MPQPKNDASENRKKAWSAADRRHNMALSAASRNSRGNELGDHYSVGADLGPAAGIPLALLQEGIGRPLLSRFPDLANRVAPSVFNFKTPNNQRAGAIDPYRKPTWREAVENLGFTVSGAFDKYPKLQKALGLEVDID